MKKEVRCPGCNCVMMVVDVKDEKDFKEKKRLVYKAIGNCVHCGWKPK